ncbi:hypothetical protein BC939DRAFT_261033 [Gamsiella multidivaricata]|uniref:uncharacterized protein n=1 Tax=Gamsiella multidivaricata TaxID=101098 RepID=UPI00221F1F63|nr:uncharacterized protein BC939DRAFT_261033 [Gamsiella multidivaricata]KAI7830767.1 hypothetical protein BC939DRAFT_261033 [Gamsiella multidivaricata]
MQSLVSVLKSPFWRCRPLKWLGPTWAMRGLIGRLMLFILEPTENRMLLLLWQSLVLAVSSRRCRVSMARCFLGRRYMVVWGLIKGPAANGRICCPIGKMIIYDLATAIVVAALILSLLADFTLYSVDILIFIFKGELSTLSNQGIAAFRAPLSKLCSYLARMIGTRHGGGAVILIRSQRVLVTQG